MRGECIVSFRVIYGLIHETAAFYITDGLCTLSLHLRADTFPLCMCRVSQHACIHVFLVLLSFLPVTILIDIAKSKSLILLLVSIQ